MAQLQQAEPDSYEQQPEELKAGFEMSSMKGEFLVARKVGETKEMTTKPVVNKPTVELCNARNVYIDPTCKGDLDKAQFVIHSYESSISELKKAGIYKNLDSLNDYEESNPILADKTANNFKFADKARKKVVSKWAVIVEI